MTFDHVFRRFEKPRPIALECWRCSSTDRVQKMAVGYLPALERTKATAAGDTTVPLCLTCRVACAW